MIEFSSLCLAVGAPVFVMAEAREEETKVAAMAAALPGKRQVKVLKDKSARKLLLETRLHADRIGYTGGKGYRRIAGGDVTRSFGATALTLEALQGERNHGRGKASHEGVQVGALVRHEWTSGLATAISLSVASDSPVFGRLQAGQSVLLRLGVGTKVEVGGRYASFHDGTEMVSGVAGISRSFGRAQLSYRVSAFAPAGGGTSSAHLVGVELADGRDKGKGKTSLSLGAGDSLHELDWRSALVAGRYRTLGLKRSQPVTGSLGLSVSLGRTWYELPQASYEGTKFGFSLGFKR